MRSTLVLLRSFIPVVICLALAPWAKAVPLARAQRFPDSMVASVWAPDGQRWIRLEQVAPGHYRGSVEFESGGWMTAYEYYEFTCQLTLGNREAPLRFHHEFRVASGEAAEPSELWAVLTYDWDVGAFLQTEDLAAVFDAPASEENQELGPVVGPVAGGLAGIARTSTASSATPPVPAGPILTFAGAPSSGAAGKAGTYDPLYGPSVYGRDGYDYNGYDRDGFDRSGYDRGGRDRAGYDRNGYDTDGYGADGYDRNGVDRQGFNRQGIFQEDFDAEGYDSTGYDRDGFDREGYDRNGRDREGYDHGGFDVAGYSRFGGYLYGYGQGAAAPNADASPALDARGFGSDGLNVNGTYYDDLGYDAYGYDAEGYYANGYDRAGFDQFGFDPYGYDANGLDASGFDHDGRDAAGYDREGRNRRGFNRDGIYRDGTLYDDRGYDQHGYDRAGQPDLGNSPQDPAPAESPPAPTNGSSQKELKDLLSSEGFAAELSDDDAFIVTQMQREAAGLPPLTAEEYDALAAEYFRESLYRLWYDLHSRILDWEAGNGLDDEPIDDLLAKRKQVEDYLIANEGVSGGGGVAARKSNPSVLEERPGVAGRTERSGIREALTSAVEWMEEHPKTMGLVRGFGGVAEVIAGATTALGTGGAASPWAVPLILHGVDQIVAGATQAATGEPAQSGLEKAVTATAEAAGASSEAAKAIGTTVDATAGIALSFGVGATQGVARAAASEAEALDAVTKEATVAGAAAKETQVAAVGEAAGGLPKVVETGAIGEIKTPYQIAKEGGRHSGLLKNYAGKAPEEIRKGIASMEKQVALHKDKIQNPDKYIPDFMKLDVRQQQALLQSKWPSDIERLNEQIDVLKGLLRE